MVTFLVEFFETDVKPPNLRSEILPVFGSEDSLDKEEFSSLNMSQKARKKEQHKEFVAQDLVKRQEGRKALSSETSPF